MPAEKKLKDHGNTKSAETVAALAQPLIDAAIDKRNAPGVIVRIFESTHDILRAVEIPNEAKLQQFLRAMISSTQFETSSIQSRERSPEMEEFLPDGKVVGSLSTTLGKYLSDGCYNIWFERSPQQEWILAYSKVPVGGNLR